MSDLEQLAGEAEGIAGPPAGQAEPGAPGAPGAPADQAAPPMDNVQAVGMGLALLREALCIGLKAKSPARTMADERLEPLAIAWGKVFDEKGIRLADKVGGSMGIAVMTTVPMAVAVYRGLELELTERRAAKAPAPAPAPGAAAAAAADGS